MPYSRRIPFVGSALTYAQEVLADSPNAYWKMNEASGNLADSSGNALTLTANGGPTYLAAGPGAAQKAITFVAASSQYFDRADGAASPLDFGDVFTLEVWYKRSAVQGTDQCFFAKDVGCPYIKMGSDNKIQAHIFSAQNLMNSSAALTDTASWHHIVFTKNGATSAMYLDGASVGVAGTNGTCTNNNGDQLVAAVNTPTWFMSGSLSHVAMYATALSAARVSAHYAAMV